ncbi:MAG: PAS domain-containing protein [Spirochaetes bacterium]|nr:PAS domain-containing protein [Spirochaetota bacterium]MBU1079144.1 PAS domain-containing protein [Spirochaetota bacterium]
MPDWVTRLPGAVTVSDRDRRIVYMNDAAAATWAAKGGRALIGSSLEACHNERSRGIIDGLLSSGGVNVYTIEKAGVKKLIHQSAWRDESGAVAGLVELSLVLPEGMPHFVRG